MGEASNPHVRDSGISERVLSSPNHLFLSLETPRYLNENQENPAPFLKHIILGNFKMLESAILKLLEKMDAE